MIKVKKSITILLADDDKDNRLLVEEMLINNLRIDQFHCVESGEELMDYLYQQGQYTDPIAFPRPNLILLELNLPDMDGRKALAEIKKSSTLRQIPIIVLTSSKAKDDIDLVYALGANSYITKPVNSEELLRILRVVSKYWFEIVHLPV